MGKYKLDAPELTILWRDRKRIIFGLPWTFTVYSLTPEKLLTETGLLNKKQEEVRLYRIMDITLERPLGQRIFGLGSIHCCSADKSSPEFTVKRVKQAQRVKELLSNTVEKEREAKRVYSREFMSDADGEDMF